MVRTTEEQGDREFWTAKRSVWIQEHRIHKSRADSETAEGMLHVAVCGALAQLINMVEVRYGLDGARL